MQRSRHLIPGLIAFLLFAGCLLLLPTGSDIRVQRFSNFTYAMLWAVGVFVLVRINVLAGLMIFLANLALLQIVSPETELLILSLIVFFVGIVYTRRSWGSHLPMIYDLIIVIACLNLAFQIMQYFGVYFIVHPNPGTEASYTGLMGNINETSALYAACLGAFLRKKRCFLLPAVALGLILAQSLSGVIGCAAVLTLWALRNVRVIALACVCSGLLLAVVSYALFVDHFNYESQADSRGTVWLAIVETSIEKPLGWGFNQFNPVIPLLTSMARIKPELRGAYYQGVADKEAFQRSIDKMDNLQTTAIFADAHNEYLQWLFISGFPGFFIGVLYIFRLLIKGLHIRDHVPLYGFLGVAVCGLFFSVWHIMPLIVLSVLYVGMIESAKYKKAKERA